MAITALDYAVILRFKKQGLLPLNPSILELGESNWYGDIPIEKFKKDIEENVTDAEFKKEIFDDINKIFLLAPEAASFNLAKIFFKAFIKPKSLDAIDFHGPNAIKHDLNTPIKLDKQYEIIMNYGTAEHIFNIYQFFKTIHEATAPNGLIFQYMPFTGWKDHGFYNFQPTFYFDLAAVNNYKIELIAPCRVNPFKIQPFKSRDDVINYKPEDNELIYSVFRKPEKEEEFKVPIQGYYSGALSPEAKSSWQTR